MEEDEIKFCPKCGKTLKSGQLFCSDCGWKVEKVTQSYAPQQSNHGSYNLWLAVKIIVVCCLVIAAVFVGYDRFFKDDAKSSESYINMVKKAHYNGYDNFSYGQVLGQYCDGEEWEYFRTEDGSDIVVYTTANGVYDGKNSQLEIQFKCENDKVNYEYFEVNGDAKSTLDTEKFINTVYSSYLPDGADRNIMSLMDEKMSTIQEKYCMQTDDDDTLQDDMGINFLSNPSWSVMDYDNDGNNDGVSIDNETKYNIMGITYGQDYKEALEKIPYNYKHSELINTDTGAGAIYAQNDRYYMRIKVGDNKVSGIMFVNTEKAKAAGEQFVSINGDDADDTDTNSSSDNDSADNNMDDYDNDDDYGDETDYDESEDYDDESDDSDYYDDDDISQEAIDARWDDSDSYILPYSDVEKLKKSDVEKLNLKTIQFAINEICARKGRKFLDHKSNTKYPELKEYFESKDWYVPKYDSKKFDSNVRKYLNDVEYYNYDLLASVRNKKQ